MSAGARLTFCAALASLLTACSLLPLATPTVWLVQAAVLVLAQSAVGAVGRRIPLARPLTVALQAVVSLALLALVFVRGQAVLGVLPGPSAIDGLGRLLGDGVRDVGQYATPAPVTGGIRLLLVGGVLLIALVVDVLAVTYRSAAPAGLPLLALFSIASGLDEGGGHWLWFLLAAGGYLLLLLAEGRDRLSRWGRVFGGAARRSGPPADAAGHGAVAPVRTGRRIGALALGLALVVPALLPAMGGGLLDAGDPDGPLGHGGGTITAVNPLVSLQNNLNQPADREVLRYRTTSPDALSMYLRVITLDQFDGTSWKASTRGVTDVPGTLPSPAGLSPGVQVSQVATSIAAASWYAQSYLPLPYPATRVRIGGNWRYEPEGRTLVGDHGQTTANAQYQVASLLVAPTARQLADAPPAPDRIRREYTRVPGSLPPEVRQTAQQVTRGATNDYERAVKLQNWFTLTGGFTYDTRVQEGSGPDAIVRFLHDRRGFCVHFAFTMAAMARTLGIPARVDVGFVPGTQQPDNSWSVGLKDAHAWPELYFEGVGWTRFEPTPSRGSTPDYTRDTSTLPSGHDPAGPQQGASAAPSANPSAGTACAQGGHRADDCGAVGQPAFGAPTGGNGPGGGVLAGLVGVVLLGALCALPMVWRSRVRTARLARAEGSPGGGGLTAWLERADGSPGAQPGRDDGAPGDRVLAGWRELVDSAWDYGVLPNDAETPRRAADRLVRVARLDDEAAAAARRLAVAVEQALYAPAPGPVAEVAEDVRRVRRALYAGADRVTRLRAVLAPRSAARLGWRVADRWGRVVRRGREVAERAAAVVRVR
ncbi:transglutaminase family protein [Streptomyces sp. RPT161]|uniref:transglutaminase family protein n=1 Tax=Streptomyces sp. RPT161 TaxID=3015993 RepID=UPI0022B88FBF|nr:DUF3488 and transglutaminase-like domain-containing protein [Streptomyces sp. RPT161]